jgi:hypothetical protein
MYNGDIAEIQSDLPNPHGFADAQVQLAALDRRRAAKIFTGGLDPESGGQCRQARRQ